MCYKRIVSTATAITDELQTLFSEHRNHVLPDFSQLDAVAFVKASDF